MIEFDWQPSNRKLRQFAVCGVAIILVAGWWWHASSAVMAIIGLLSIFIGSAAWWMPHLLRPLYLGVAIVAHPVGWIIGELLLGLIYFAVFLPIGLLFGWIGRDALAWRVDRQRETYWESTPDEADAKRYYRRY